MGHPRAAHQLSREDQAALMGWYAAEHWPAGWRGRVGRQRHTPSSDDAPRVRADGSVELGPSVVATSQAAADFWTRSSS